jgi:hypothetical protein
MFILTGSGFVITRTEESFTKVVVEGVDDISKVQLIIDTINGKEIITPRNVLCIFGHSTSRGTAYGYNCKVYATAPRCVKITYAVTYCTRSSCDYVTYTQTGSARISCC